MQALLVSALELCPQLQRVVLAAEGPVPLSQPYLLHHFMEAGEPQEARATYETLRSRVRPRLSMRPAVVEDTDDLLPVIEASAPRYGALATVPANCNVDSACPLADLLANQDASSVIHVAGAHPCQRVRETHCARRPSDFIAAVGFMGVLAPQPNVS